MWEKARIMKREKGSLLIETMVGLFILSVIGWISFTLTISIRNSIAMKRKERVLYESFNAVGKELKYNYSIQELDSRLIGGKITIPYKEDFLLEVRDKELFSIVEEDRKIGEFSIELKENKDEYKRYKLKLNIRGEVLEQDIIKAPWISEIR